MEIEGCQEIDLEFEAHDLIDNYQFPDTADAKKEVNSLGIDANDHLPELHESTEPERNQKNGRYNLRKSLAWDSAFFTSAGVLDAEELSSMITKTDKKEKHILPGIQEEITGSTESISTLQSDCLTLETFEDDLFLDIRASIQRSSKKASNLIKSSSKIPAMELDGPAISSPKKEDFVFQTKNPKPGVKKTSGLQTVRMSKSQLKPIAKLSSGRSIIKQDSVQSQAGPIGKTGGTNSVLLKPLKTIGSSVPSSTAAKRESVGTGRVKPECGSSKQGSIPGKGIQLPKASALGGSRKMLPKPAVALKSSSLGSLATSSVHSTRSSTSSDNSINTSSGNTAKPTLMTARRNLVKSNNISTGASASGSIPKTPSRAVPKNKLPAPSLSTYLKSTKISSSVSPASSISEWSSASSTTSSLVKQRSSISRTSLDTSSCRSVDGDSIRLDPRDNPTGQKAERQENQGAMKPTLTSKKSSAESGTLHAPVKPSGLRLPSPKIGFFDGSSSRTPNGHQRSQSALPPKNGAATSTPTRSSNGKLKSAKVPTAKMATSLANIKSGSPKAASPASSQEKSHALVEASDVSVDVNDSSSLSLGVKGSATGETFQKAVEVEAENSKLKNAKVPTARLATSLVKIKSGSPKAASPASSQEKSRALVEASSVSVDVNDSSSLSPGVNGSGTGETCHCHKKVEAEAENGNLKSAEVPTESGSPKAASPASSQEKSCALVEASNVSMDVNDSSSLSLGVKGSGTGEAFQKKVETEAENGNLKSADVPTAGMDASMDVNDSSSLSLGVKGSGTAEAFQKKVEAEAANGNLKSAEVPAAGMDASSPNMKSGSPKAASPASSQERSRALAKASSVSMDVNDSSSLSFGVKGSATGEACQKKVEAEAENGNLKSAEVPTARVDTSLANIMSGSPKAASPASSQEMLHDLVKTSSVTMDINDTSSLSFGVKGSATEEICQETVEVVAESGVKQVVVDASTGAVDKDNLGDLRLNGNMSSGDIETAIGEGISQIGDGILIKKDGLERNSIPTSEAIEKENDPAYCQVEGLTGDKRGIYQKNQELNCQLLCGTSECALSSTAAACRPPFALKNFSCSKEFVDKPADVVFQVAVAENTGFALPASIEKENS
ncbi:mediator of RNA polymerase II transcription subunit-like protein [Perilla frutescens var. hirtella]|nr:mediator of RNA polymerase II transcription subunit-like protein [Perilla frutescens var. hirtella]